MKKLLLAAPIAAAALAIARYFVIITSLDPETGFSNKPLPVILFSAVLILVAAAPIALRFVMKKLTDDRLNGYYTCKMPVYAISAAIAGGAYLIATTSVSQFMAALERMGAPRSFSITLAVTLRFLPALRQDLRHIRDAMALRNIRGFEEKLECIYVPMLMGAAQTAEELSESATARGIEYPGKMSSWRPIGFHIQDVVVTLLFLALCVGGICCKGVLP